MATSNVNVRFSVENAEVVRKALEDMGKDGEAALRKLNAASDKPSSGLKAISDLVSGLKDKIIGMAVPLGPAGTALIALGPAGIAAAAGLGLAISAFSKMTEMAEQLGQRAVQIRAFAETTGFTTDQVQGLTDAAAKHGVVADQVVGAVQRFTQGWEQLRRGGGAMLEEINRINPALADQMQRAGSAAAAWDIFSRAVAKADVQQRNMLLRAAGGRSGVTALSGVADDTAKAGGIGNLTNEAKDAGSVIQKELIDRLAVLRAQSESAGDTLRTKIASIFAEPVLTNQKNAREELSAIVDLIKNFTAPKAWTDFWEGWKAYARAHDVNPGFRVPAPDQALRDAPAPMSGHSVPGADQALRDVPAPVPLTPEEELNRQREMLAILGAAATPQEQYLLRVKEINAAIDKNSTLEQYRGRAVGAASLAQSNAIESLKERLGVYEPTKPEKHS